MALLSVRLAAKDARRVSDLERAGVHLSRVVREAIRSEHARLLGNKKGRRRAAEVMREIYAAAPDPENLPKRRYDVHDSRQAKRAIVKKLRRGRG